MRAKSPRCSTSLGAGHEKLKQIDRAASKPCRPKAKELIAELKQAGFDDRGGKGSHRNFTHPRVSKPITISGSPSDDAKHYQIRAVKSAIEESKR